MTPNAVISVWAGGGLLAAVFLFFAIRAGRRVRFLIDTPTSKARGVFIGQVELVGRAASGQPLSTFIAGEKAVWFDYEISEEWERWETETTTDNKGNTQTRQVLRSGWTAVAEGGESPPFFVEDDTGSVLVQPNGATIEPVQVFSEVVGRGDPLYFGKGPASEIGDSNHKRRFTERAIPLGATLFVAGRARERSDVVAPEIADDNAQELFLISCRGEGKVRRGYRWKFWVLGVLALLPLPGVAAIVASERGVDPDWRVLASVAGSVAAVWALSWMWMSFNSLVQLRNRVAQASSLIDVELKRRADLIPRLVTIVTGLRDYERTVQTEVASLRAQSTATVPGAPGTDVASAQGALRAVVERYPELKSSDAFLRLQRELADTETRVALARDYFNEIAAFLNSRLETVPDRWIAPVAGLQARPLLGAESFERAAVTANLEQPLLSRATVSPAPGR